MERPSSQLCPKCNKPYKYKRQYNSNYDVYVHKQNDTAKGLNGLIDVCIVTKDYEYNHPEPDITGRPLNPGYRRLKSPAYQ